MNAYVNSYGFSSRDLPSGKYGIYDAENGCWIGEFFDTLKEAEDFLVGEEQDAAL